MNNAPRPAVDLAHADVAVVYATSLEMTPFFDRCTKMRKYTGGGFVFHGGRLGNVRVAFAQAGMGAGPARRATQALLDAHSPQWVVSAGFSGGLLPEMKVGNIAVAREIVDQHGGRLSVDLQMEPNAAAGLFVGRLLMVDGIVRTVDERQRLAAAHAAIACDMESFSVAAVCQETHTRFLAVRVISDDATVDLPPEILTIVGGTGSVRLGAAVGAVWKRPASVKELWNLREQAHHAAERLATFLDGVIVQLHAAK